MADVLEPDSTCWRIERARRVRLLVDGAEYYAALRAALLEARHRVDIVGWDIDSRVRLHPGANEDEDVPLELGALLRWLCARRPSLQIRLLLWDYSLLYAFEREPLPRVRLGWNTPAQVQVCLDDYLPVGASHHQKLVVVDDVLAFCGGLDLTIRRWDTREHRAKLSERVDPDGEAYEPFHDVQMMVDGDAALALAELVRGRWEDARCEETQPPRPGDADRWPSGYEPQFHDVRIAISRTLPELPDRPAVREVEHLYLRAIATAEREMYIENQYLSSRAIADALLERLAENPALGVVIVGPAEPGGWLEARTMGAGRLRFWQTLARAGVDDRVRLLFPGVPDDGDIRVPVMVHAKLMVVDDRFLTVGSANLNNRSMGFDTECNLALVADDAGEREQLRAIRDDLIAEHLGCELSEVAFAIEREGSLLAAVDALRGEGRSLFPIEDQERYADLVAETVEPLADPERPVPAQALNLELFDAVPKRPPMAALVQSSLLAALIAALALAWYHTPLRELTDPAVLRDLVEDAAVSSWTPALVLMLFAVLGLLMFPVTVLVLLTAVVFEPAAAFAYALGGSLASATLAFGAGRVAGQRFVRQVVGARVHRISRMVADRGVIAIFALRNLPVAPFTVVNVVAGVSHVRFRDFLLGSVLGMAPGIAAISLLGQSIWQLFEDPGLRSTLLLIGAAALWVLLGFGLQKLVNRLRQRDGD